MAKDPNFPMQGKLGGMGGQYGRKAENLTKKQLKRAGATKAAAKQTVDIERTSRATEGVNKGRTLGPGGKPLTGSVKLLNGKIAVYKAGKRVINVKPVSKDKPKPPPPPPKTRKTTMIQSSMVARREKESVSSYKNSKPTKPYNSTGKSY